MLTEIVYGILLQINISNHHDVNLSLNASENGGFENDDIFYSEYSLDGGVWTYFSINAIK